MKFFEFFENETNTSNNTTKMTTIVNATNSDIEAQRSQQRAPKKSLRVMQFCSLFCYLICFASGVTAFILPATGNHDKNGSYTPTDKQSLIGNLAAIGLFLSICIGIPLCMRTIYKASKNNKADSEKTLLLPIKHGPGARS